MRNILYRFAVWLFQQKTVSTRRTGLSTALACGLLILAETALADHNEYATDHEFITIDLGDSVISNYGDTPLNR